MEDDDRRATRRDRELSMKEKEDLSEGRKIFRVKNDDAALDGAEMLFRMNRHVLDMENAVRLLESIGHDRICKANSFCPKVELHHRHCIGNQVQTQLFRRFEEPPPLGYSIDGTKLSRLPPLKPLEGIIESCSYPFQKQLTKTDTSKTHNRLTLNSDNVKSSILPLLYFLKYSDKDLQRGIAVTAYDSRGNKYPMMFKTWLRKKVYLLNSEGWNSFNKDLVKWKDWVSVWFFSRKQSGELCFALNVERFPTPTPVKKRSRREGPK